MKPLGSRLDRCIWDLDDVYNVLPLLDYAKYTKYAALKLEHPSKQWLNLAMILANSLYETS